MNRFVKNIIPVAVGVVLGLGAVSCADELDQRITDPQTNTTLDHTGLLAKIYGNLTLTGVTGGAGNADMAQFDEGNSSFYRRIFEANELCSDECIWTWQDNAGIPELTNLSWNSSHGYNELTYYRIMYNITLCNFYLDETEGTTDTQVLQNRAEVRFIRALHYYYFMDLYGRAPFKEHFNEDLPVEKTRAEVFAYVESELKAINGDDEESNELLLDNTNDDTNYGRANKVAADLLLARIYLNAKVYTGVERWSDAKNYAERVINSGYSLCTDPLHGYTAYQQLFMGDNGENTNARKEIIFPIRCDGATSRSFGGSTYTIASTTGDGTPLQGLPASTWRCNRAREAMVKMFFSDLSTVPMVNDPTAVAAAAGDDRALFFSGAADDGSKQRTISTEELTTFTAGLGIMKWSNVYTDGSTPHDVTFPDTDVPFFRVAEAYLILAEANLRAGGENETTLNAINTIRTRAHAAPLTSVTESDLIDEWAREFYFEGRRRSDLIRFGLFTSGNYIWDWKGGSYEGNGVSEIYNLYPIPANELNSNANMHQNAGY